jgi:hypothetical protein
MSQCWNFELQPIFSLNVPVVGKAANFGIDLIRPVYNECSQDSAKGRICQRYHSYNKSECELQHLHLLFRSYLRILEGDRSRV